MTRRPRIKKSTLLEIADTIGFVVVVAVLIAGLWLVEPFNAAVSEARGFTPTAHNNNLN
tara:strand:- start:2582 stop:2758 length:177 start_codon:yes stop_codon:yes gene_type:complete